MADSKTAVLIQGETGTGQELGGRATHDESPRSDGPFVTVNCAALEVQRQLLRVPEDEAITRLGETQSRPVDVRIVAATHRNLDEEVEADRFR